MKRDNQNQKGKMKPSEVFDKTQDMTQDFVGVFLRGEVRAGWTKYGWQAYIVTYNTKGNIKTVRMLRTKDGKPVRVFYHWEGIVDLAEKIEQLYKGGKL